MELPSIETGLADSIRNPMDAYRILSVQNLTPVTVFVVTNIVFGYYCQSK